MKNEIFISVLSFIGACFITFVNYKLSLSSYSEWSGDLYFHLRIFFITLLFSLIFLKWS